jgi:hypothetical protein
MTLNSSRSIRGDITDNGIPALTATQTLLIMPCLIVSDAMLTLIEATIIPMHNVILAIPEELQDKNIL